MVLKHACTRALIPCALTWACVVALVHSCKHAVSSCTCVCVKVHRQACMRALACTLTWVCVTALTHACVCALSLCTLA